MLNRKTILIIGAGVSGLSAGINAQKHGFNSIILEKNDSVGGLCTGWNRYGQHLDGCIHWLTGTKENTELNRMWKDLGTFSSQDDLIYLDSWGTFDYQGVKVTFWKDIKKAEKEWLEIAPEDKREIHHFFKMVRDFNKIELPLSQPIDHMSIFKVLNLGLKVLSVWPSYLLSMIISTEKYAKKFKNPALRWAMKNVQPGDGNLFSMLYSYSTIVDGNGGIPKSGSKAMVERMKDRYLSLGGTLKLNTEVNNILFKNKTAVGVLLKDGRKVYGDYVVTCVDPNYVTNKLLYGFYKIPTLEKRYQQFKACPAPSCCLFYFDIEDMPSISIPYSFETEPFYVGGEKITHLTLRSYGYDSDTFKKNNRTVCSVMIDQYSEHYAYWNDLYKNHPNLYKRTKNQLAEAIMFRLIHKFPNFKGKIRILDVCTPKTLNRYTNASRGAYMGFLFTHKDPMFTHNGQINGLKNLYLSGQWMQCPGGLPLAAAQGKFAIQRICKKENVAIMLSPKGHAI